jgi:hypothetical protein
MIKSASKLKYFSIVKTKEQALKTEVVAMRNMRINAKYLLPQTAGTASLK